MGSPITYKIKSPFPLGSYNLYFSPKPYNQDTISRDNGGKAELDLNPHDVFALVSSNVLPTSSLMTLFFPGQKILGLTAGRLSSAQGSGLPSSLGRF